MRLSISLLNFVNDHATLYIYTLYIPAEAFRPRAMRNTRTIIISLHNTTANSRSLFTYFAFIGFAYLLSLLFVYTHTHTECGGVFSTATATGENK